MSATETETATPSAGEEDLEPHAETGAGDELADDELDEAHTPAADEPTEEELAALAAEAEQLAGMQKQMKALDRAQATYRKKVVEIMALDSEPPECAHCAGTGFDLKGEGAPAELQEHERYRQCEACAGEGFVKTGSRREELAAIECPGCNGRGFQELLNAPGTPPGDDPQYGTPAWMGTVADTAA